jgi:DNA sulfur modification protein DndD
MRINKIKLCNFGSFEGEVEFDISVSQPDKNVVLIGGRNGSGKTTLFIAIRLALYGYIAFGYQSANASYLNNIKINKNSLAKKNVSSYVSLDFDLDEDRETANYLIVREWKYEKKKLRETHLVKRNGIELSEDEKLSFENYIKFLLPPQLFDLFFFDGEKISDFFLQGNSNKNLKEALLVLCGYDTFEIIKNNFRRNIHKDTIMAVAEEEQIFINLLEEEDKILKALAMENERLVEIDDEIRRLQEVKQEVEKNFRKAGGLLAQEIAEIKNAIAQEEKFREEKNEWLKIFANETLPFIIVGDLVRKVKEQIYRESNYQKYQAIRETLNPDFLRNLIEEEIQTKNVKIIDSNNNNFSEDFVKLLAKHIDEKIRPDFDTNMFKVMHGLSRDEEDDLLLLIKHIESQDANQIKQCKEQIAGSIKRSQDLKKRLELCESNDQLSGFIEEINKIRDNIEVLAVEKQKIIDGIQKLENSKKDLEEKIKKAKDILTKVRKDKSIISLCIKAQSMLDNFIPMLIDKKLKSVKQNFLFMFKNLISKQNYVDDIDIDSNFNITLYRNGFSTKYEIENMISNLGIDGFANHMGEKCIDALKKYFKVLRREELEKAIKINEDNEIIPLPVKVDINGFSKGEQQIYIMALYWALVKLSNNNIPFIIDTPYARIDEIHRGNITTKFFPSLSNQVIILSTDSEVNSEYYKLLKPFIAKQYTINYSDMDKRTYLENKYFFEVAS